MFNGITRGVELLRDYLKGFVRIVPNKPEALEDFLEVARIWLAEVTRADGSIKKNWLGVPDIDPKQSREALRRLRNKYGF